MNKQELLKLAQEKLNKVELRYFKIMFAQSGVLFLKGRPGTAKSAILRSIADKLDMMFVDLRLPTMDETDLGVFPVVTYQEFEFENGEKIEMPVLDHAVPKWASETALSNKYCIIVFEELNRAERAQRNASLGALNERIIGHNFKFGPNVFMAATGNIGSTEDGSDVEEFDTALKGRLITITHRMEGADGIIFWKESYAKDNVHPDILRYLEEHPTHFYPEMKESGSDKDVVIQPRTWTNLSHYIVSLHGMNSTIDDYGADLLENGKSYIGSFVSQLHRYLTETKRVTIADLLAGRIKDFGKLHRENLAEILNEMKALDMQKLKAKETKAVISLFHWSIDEHQDTDQIAGVLYDWVLAEYSKDKAFIKSDNAKKVLFDPKIKEKMKYLGSIAPMVKE